MATGGGEGDGRVDTAAMVAALRAVAIADDAGPMAAYMRHVAPFLGVKTPARKAALRPFLADVRRRAVPPDEVIRAASHLFAMPEREFAYGAIDLLQVRIRDFAWDGIVHGVVPLLDAVPWWDTVDALRMVLSRWAREEDGRLAALAGYLAGGTMWRRRVAITLQLGWHGDTDTAVLAEVIRANLADPEFFLRKAIGWALRDYGKTNPAWVRAFLDAEPVEGLARREAVKYLGSLA
jgi:3-methyladenine DNA glycosylase AlkD